MTIRSTKAVRTLRPALALAVGSLVLSACVTDRLAAVGQTPPLSPIQNPEMAAGYQPVHMPMPAIAVPEQQANSLWRSGARAFFKDQRAGTVGDILTINIQINDSAQLQNRSTRSRESNDGLNMPGLLGFERNVARILPTPNDDTLEGLLDVSSDSSNTGTGQIQRTEQIDLRVAALITQVLPNGNMVVQGRQEVRVNNEVRELTITGIIRPEDI
ncbi:MAG: flagellar L-ring protein FlgH, partial [Pseudomonadota bacterium]